MKHTIPYRMVDGHIIVTSEDGKICLIDTGSPCSVGNAESVIFAGGRYPLQALFWARRPMSCRAPSASASMSSSGWIS